MRPIALIIATMIGILVVASCQTTVLTPPPKTTIEKTPTLDTKRVGIIFENGEAETNPLYQLAQTGAEDAANVLAIEVAPLVIQRQVNATADLEGFASQDYDLLIGVGTQHMHRAIESTAQANPEQRFALIDQSADEPNVRSVQFDMAQPSFLAGYLAAGVSANGVVCTHGSLDVPGVIDYLEGFANGVRYYNMQRSADVGMLGWDQDAQMGALSDSFQSSGGERKLVLGYFEAGCDVFFPVTHTINLRLASMAQDHELAIIGIDIDWFAAAPEFSNIWLTSVQKNLDQAMFNTIAALVYDTLDSEGDYMGTLANGGVGLAPFHFWDEKIPNDLKAELEDIAQLIIDEKLDPRDKTHFH